jgi:hypothetical protein
MPSPDEVPGGLLMRRRMRKITRGRGGGEDAARAALSPDAQQRSGGEARHSLIPRACVRACRARGGLSLKRQLDEVNAALLEFAGEPVGVPA